MAFPWAFRWCSSTTPTARMYPQPAAGPADRKSTRLNSSHSQISYAVFCLKKKSAGSHLSVVTPRIQSISNDRMPMTLPTMLEDDDVIELPEAGNDTAQRAEADDDDEPAEP